VIGCTKRRLILDLNGGDAILFKFNDGAPFVGFIPPQPPRLSIALHGDSPERTLTQLSPPGARYQLQSTTGLSSGAWSTLTRLLLTNSTWRFTDLPGLKAGFTARSGCHEESLAFPGRAP
jgi:hypothetical protein